MNKLRPIDPAYDDIAGAGLVLDEGPGYENYHEPKFDIRSIFIIIRRNLALIAIVILLALAAGLVVTMLTTPRYTATASIQINQSADQILETQDVQPADAIQDVDRFLQTQTDIIRSRAMSVRIAQRLGLFGNNTFLEQMKVKVPGKDSGASPIAAREAVIGLVSENMEVKLPRNSRIAQISFISPTPKLSAQIANAYADEFIKANLERRFESTGYAREFLGRQLADAKIKLEQSERALNDYARSAGLIRTTASADGGAAGGQTSVTTQSLVQLNTAANTARNDRIVAEEKWRSVAGAPLNSIPDVLSNSAYQTLLAQKAQADTDLETERSKHLDSHPSVVALRARVAEINQQMAMLARGIRDSIKSQYESAAMREKELVAQVDSYKVQTLNEQDRGVRYNILAREADTNRTLYDGLLQRFKEVSAASGITVNNISIVDQADTPLRPSSPRMMLNLLLAGMVGVGIAAVLVFLREQMDDVVRSPEDVESKLGLRLLGVIPSVADGDIREQLVDPRSALAESYSALRTALIYSTPAGLPNVILLTSSEAGEGKSTSSFALAASLAKLGKKVCLVEVDLRRPSMAKNIGIEVKGPGLTALLTSDTDVAQAVVTTHQENLYAIVAGAIPPGPTELLSGARFLQILEQLRESFDVVVLDGPPVLGLADAPIVSSIADATVYVVEANRPHRGAAKAAVRRLRSARGRLAGVVLTKFDPEKAGGNYGYYGYYGAGYYSYGRDKVS